MTNAAGEKVDIRRATEAARSLGTFTRFQLADALGVTPLEAGKWLRRLTDERDLLRRDGRNYIFDPPDEREAPPPAKYEGQDCRTVVPKLGQFTVHHLAEALGVSDTHAAKKIRWLLDNDSIRDTGKTEWRETGKQPALYEYVKAERKITSRPRHEQPQDRARREAPPMPSNGRRRDVGSGKRVRHKDSGFQRIIDAAYDAGCVLDDTSKHIKVFNPNGDFMFGLSKTPGDQGAYRHARADARRHGLPVE